MQASDFQKLEDLLSLSDREDFDRRNSPKSQREFLVTRTLLRSVMAKFHPAKQDLVIHRTSLGKPFFSGGPSFNYSHSGGQAVLALGGGGELGVDVERENPRRPLAGIVESYGNKAEVNQFKALSTDDQVKFLYKIWSLKESMAKAQGRGLSEDLQQLEFSEDFRTFSYSGVDDLAHFFYGCQKGFHYSLCHVNAEVLRPTVYEVAFEEGGFGFNEKGLSLQLITRRPT